MKRNVALSLGTVVTALAVGVVTYTATQGTILKGDMLGTIGGSSSDDMMQPASSLSMMGGDDSSAGMMGTMSSSSMMGGDSSSFESTTGGLTGGTTGGTTGGGSSSTAPVTCKNAPMKSVKKVKAPQFLDNFTAKFGPEPVEATARKQVTDSIKTAAEAGAAKAGALLKKSDFVCPDTACEPDVINFYYSPTDPTVTYAKKFADGSLKVLEYSADATCTPKTASSSSTGK